MPKRTCGPCAIAGTVATAPVRRTRNGASDLNGFMATSNRHTFLRITSADSDGLPAAMAMSVPHSSAIDADGWTDVIRGRRIVCSRCIVHRLWRIVVGRRRIVDRWRRRIRVRWDANRQTEINAVSGGIATDQRAAEQCASDKCDCEFIFHLTPPVFQGGGTTIHNSPPHFHTHAKTLNHRIKIRCKT